ncbi:MAG TPA: AAA family ATPase [Nitrospiraceae bacterium]
MYLKSLELTGFKSFAEAKINFPTGVTAVVGPNGTGKSNIVDAILWVLGEQSPKSALRCEKMEDVIFNGTETRKPLGLAEVSLVMSGLSQPNPGDPPLLPPEFGDYHEIMVTRRLYRNGDSEYLINKVACRLKDIRSLLLDTIAGTKGHTVIEQGQIEAILNSSPVQRRELIEETAGIVRYKKQKAEALRKLEATGQNLSRVRDIIAEVKQRMNALDRQARQAKNYQVLLDEARALEIRLLVQEHRALQGRQRMVEAESASLDAQESAQAAEQAQLVTQLEAIRVRMLDGDDALMRRRDEIGRLEQQQAQALRTSEVERSRAELFGQQRAQANEQLIRLESERERAVAEIAARREQLARAESEMAAGAAALAEQEQSADAMAGRRASTLEQAEQSRRSLLDLSLPTDVGAAPNTTMESIVPASLTDAAKARLETCLGRRQQAEQRIAALMAERDASIQRGQQIDGQVRDVEQQLNQQQGRLASVASRAHALSSVVREEMGYGRDGDDSVASLRKSCAGVKEAVAEWLDVPERFERAMEAALGERLRAWMVDKPADARQAIEFLKQKGLGRGTFVPANPRWSKSSRTHGWWDGLKGRPGVLGLATDLVKAASRTHDVCATLFDGIVVVDSLEQAVALWEGGQWTAPEGPTFVTLEGEVLDAAGVMTGGTTGGLLQRRREIQELETQQVDLTRAIEHVNSALARLTAEREQLAAGRRHMDEQIREAEQQRIAALLEERGVREAGLAELDEALRKMEEEHRIVQNRLTESRVAVEALRGRCGHGRADVERLVNGQEDATVRTQSLKGQLHTLAESIAQSQAERGRQETLFQELNKRVVELRQELVKAQETHAQEMQLVRQVERSLETARQALGTSRDARTGIEVRRAEIRTQLGTVEGTLTGTYQLAVEEALLREPEESAAASREELEAGTAMVREELQKIRGRLERMGPINLASIEEHREQEERYRFLTTQEADLSQSVQSLREIITRINRTTKQMFEETFKDLQQKFSEVFGRLFPGGRAELILVEPEIDPETGKQKDEEPGVDIAAQPPGKRLKGITMLSGGEKTLTAMALIFASFLIRPTPFCILDEIDAPLDEENIERFAAVLRELAADAQFLVITHNKRTMAVADSLFGVTMEEPGVSKTISVRLADLQPA